MQHIYRRCKHCNKEYLYCTYGNGPDWGTEKYCSMDYCGECQKAIDDALSNIPERYSYKMELTPKEEYDYINKTIDTNKKLLSILSLNFLLFLFIINLIKYL